MSAFARSFSSDSPVLTMSAQMSHLRDPEMTAFVRPTARREAGAVPNHHASVTTSTSLPNAAGRKRSRDEAASNLSLDDDENLPVADSLGQVEEEWEFGEGMVLIKPDQRYIIDASSQSGTWVEEKATDAARALEVSNAAIAAQNQSRPGLRSHKSQRLDQDVTSQEVLPAIIPSESSTANSNSGCSIQSLASTPNPQQPVVDDFTRHLGIGWRSISNDEHIQAAARGWARYIENHYPISDVAIRLESRGLQSYLVEAAQGFFLFSEDLRQGRLVSKDVNSVFEYLKSSPPQFDGPETLLATETPGTGTPPNFGNPIEKMSAGLVSTDMDLS